jgi:two-component system osmolarity sensor histidine kinase EnvZ
LLSNIARYARSHGEIDGNLRLSSLDGTLSLQLEDYGEGVPEHELSRLIEPFARLEAHRSDREGTGLGLAIVNRIVLRHHGSLELHRAISGGLAVRLQLPSARPVGVTA